MVVVVDMVVECISRYNQPLINITSFILIVMWLEGLQTTWGCWKGQFCSVWVAERFPEEMTLANERGHVLLGKRVILASCWGTW